MLEIFPKYGTVVTTGFWTNILLANFTIHLSTNFVEEAFLSRVFLSVSTSKWNLEKSDTIVKLKFVFDCYVTTKISVYTIERIFFGNTCCKFIFLSTNFNVEKRKGVIFFSFKRKFNISVFFVSIINKSQTCSSFSNNTKMSSTYLL